MFPNPMNHCIVFLTKMSKNPVMFLTEKPVKTAEEVAALARIVVTVVVAQKVAK